MAEIKVFRLNDFDWWAGHDLESVKAAYLAEMDEDESVFDDPRELTEEEMDRFKFVDGDDPINADGSPGGELSFRDALARSVSRGDSFPGFFASTEY